MARSVHIEYPVKTMNIHDSRDLYQVDTGPLAWPDLSTRPERLVDSLALAFVAFNAPDFADFVVEAPTPITDAALAQEGQELCKVHHYSRVLTLPATNRLYALAARQG